jgi:hypothetical protein
MNITQLENSFNEHKIQVYKNLYLETYSLAFANICRKENDFPVIQK